MWVQYYDVMTDGISSFGFSLAGFVFLLLGCFIFITSYKTKNDKDYTGIFVGAVLIFVAIMFITSTFFGRLHEYNICKELINTNSYKVIEGKIENFIPQSPIAYPKKETFTIKNIPFEYSSGVVTVGYNKPKYKGGVIDANKYVRIHYYEGEILRLWVLEESKK